MRKTLPLLLAATLVVGACATVRESRVNPLNWFGQSREAPVAQTENANPLIPRRGGGLFANRRAENAIYKGTPIDQVTNVTVERVPGGAIIRATGIAARQGIYEVQLTPENEEGEPIDGTLTYRLEGIRPSRATPVGTQPTREVIAATRVTDKQLSTVRRIRIEGARNAQVTRR